MIDKDSILKKAISYLPQEIICFEIRIWGRYFTMSTALRNAEIIHQELFSQDKLPEGRRIIPSWVVVFEQLNTNRDLWVAVLRHRMSNWNNLLCSLFYFSHDWL